MKLPLTSSATECKRENNARAMHSDLKFEGNE